MPPARPSRLGRALGGAAVGLLLAGCGSQPPLSPPTGVDELVIPTPSPDPADFVAGVDNRWLPLAAGTRWTYQVEGRPGAATLTAQVLPGTRTVAGIATTVVRDTTRTAAGAVTATVERLYAQDRAGNVWWLGRVGGAGSWLAGTDGAEAGLAMPAAPRLGDGFRTAYAEGLATDVDTVTSLDASAVTPYDEVDGALRLEQTATASGRTDQLTYAPGVGLVLSVQVTGGGELLALTALTRP